MVASYAVIDCPVADCPLSSLTVFRANAYIGFFLNACKIALSTEILTYYYIYHASKVR